MDELPRESERSQTTKQKLPIARSFYVDCHKKCGPDWGWGFPPQLYLK